MFILLVLLALVVSFLITAGLVWLLCWLLPAIGIVAIGTFTIVFSWKLALAIWLIIALLRSIFSSVSKNWKEVIKMNLNTDFSYMTDEELDELISRIKEARERRSESRKTDLWNNVRRAVNNYIMDFGMSFLPRTTVLCWTLILSASPAKSILWIKTKERE